jgi:hypothetical protein
MAHRAIWERGTESQQSEQQQSHRRKRSGIDDAADVRTNRADQWGRATAKRLEKGR